MRILAVCGSLQRTSANLELLRTAAELAPPRVDISLCDCIRNLPHFDPDVDALGAPQSVLEWRAQLAACDAVLIACPEYGHSLPGALKNAIDWVIGTGELYMKPVAITASVSAAERGRMGLAALRTTLLAVDAQVLWDTPVVRGASSGAELANLLEALRNGRATVGDPSPLQEPTAS